MKARIVYVLAGQRGNAYVFVVIAVLVMALLAGTALVVTARGRQASAYYREFAGLYELAKAGNEQALYTLRGVFDPDNIWGNAQYASGPWQVIADGEILFGHTAVSVTGALFGVRTSVHRVGQQYHPTVVQAYIILDENLLTMVNSRRVTP